VGEGLRPSSPDWGCAAQSAADAAAFRLNGDSRSRSLPSRRSGENCRIASDTQKVPSGSATSPRCQGEKIVFRRQAGGRPVDGLHEGSPVWTWGSPDDRLFASGLRLMVQCVECAVRHELAIPRLWVKSGYWHHRSLSVRRRRWGPSVSFRRSRRLLPGRPTMRRAVASSGMSPRRQSPSGGGVDGRRASCVGGGRMT